MREELNEEKMENVNGGRFIINANLHKISFRDAKRMFDLKNCSDWEAAALCDSFRGKYATEQEFDNACIAALQAKGWI